MNLVQQIAVMAAQANETDEERAERLTESAEAAGADPETLFEVEEDLRGFGRHYADEHREKVEQFEQKAQSMAPMLGMDPDQTDALGPETLIKLLSQYAVARPEVTATAVANLHATFRRRGLYDELGTEPLSPGKLAPPVDTVALGGED